MEHAQKFPCLGSSTVPVVWHARRNRLRNGGVADRLGQGLIDALPQLYRAQFVNWCLQLSTHKARRRVTASDSIKVLIDNSVLGHASTHETVGIVQKTDWPPGGEPGEVTVAKIEASLRHPSQDVVEQCCHATSQEHQDYQGWHGLNENRQHDGERQTNQGDADPSPGRAVPPPHGPGGRCPCSQGVEDFVKPLKPSGLGGHGGSSCSTTC